MRYTFQSIRYIIKNFLYIFPLVVLPALALSFTLDKPTIKTLLADYFGGRPRASFPAVFRCVSIFNFRSLPAFFAGLAGIVLMVLCASMLLALIEKHMRIGKRTFNGLLSKLNDNLISTCGVCVLYAAIYEVWALVLSALLFCVSLADSVVAVYVLTIFVYLGMLFVLLYVVSLFYLWLPCLQITGFRAFEALRYSYQLVAPIKGKIIFGQLISVLVCECLLGVVASFVPGRVASFAVAAILYAFMTLMFCVRMQVIYFDRTQTERADLKKYYHF